MDYRKLKDETLDEIMKQIRMQNNNAVQVAVKVNTSADIMETNYCGDGSLELNADMAVLDKFFADAAVGRTIGLKKSPMYKQRGLKLKVARVIEKIYLRVSELSNRYVREFNGIILYIISALKDKICVLFKNDAVLRDMILDLEKENASLRNELNQMNTALRNELNQMNTALRDELNQMEDEILDLDKERTALSEELNVMKNKFFSTEQASQDDLNKCLGEVQNIREIIANIDTDIKTKTPVIVEHLNDHMQKIRSLENGLASVSAKTKWKNSTNHLMKAEREDAEDSAVKFTEDPIFYHDFEEVFRGTQDDIRQRLEVYLPLVQKHFGSLEKKRFVDIGCGRGEWLDMIAANGADDYIGIDLNPVQVDICKQKGHTAEVYDCMKYLDSIPAESVDMITGIQIIEHFSTDDLLLLLSKCRRVLKRDGMILFETPNPSNLLVGSTWFYVDPTHVHPIHKEFARFLVERSGYEDVSVIEANPEIYSQTLMKPICTDGNQVVWDENINILNNLLYGPRDYAVVGVKGNE